MKKYDACVMIPIGYLPFIPRATGVMIPPNDNTEYTETKKYMSQITTVMARRYRHEKATKGPLASFYKI